MQCQLKVARAAFDRYVCVYIYKCWKELEARTATKALLLYVYMLGALR